MEQFDVAHVRQSGVDLIIVVVTESFGQRSPREQEAAVRALTACARGAGLAGTVVPVWVVFGRLHFLAPTNFHPFFASLDPLTLASMVNRRLTCNF